MKYALIIGNDKYKDSKLAQLNTPQVDSQELARTLKNEKIGNFDQVRTLINQPESKARLQISEFLSNKKPDDLVLLYFSGHGVLDDRGSLFLAFKDTRTQSLNATALPSSFISYEIDNCRSRRLILILDCCNSGAFARGTKGTQKAITEATFEGNGGTGRFVLTASDSTQYALEGDKIISQSKLSLFTHFLLQGLQTGEADTNQDGFVSLDEWYDYSHSKITEKTHQQTPQKWSYRQQGDLIIAKNPFVKKRSVGIKAVENKLTTLLRSREADYYYEIKKLRRLNSKYQINLEDLWQQEYENFYDYLVEKLGESLALVNDTWSKAEFDKLEGVIVLLSDLMGGHQAFVRNLGGVTVGKRNIGSHSAEALAHRINLSTQGTFSGWTVVHELAHAWDANHRWNLSVALERYTGGFTSPAIAFIKRLVGSSDSRIFRAENLPGRRGRRPGCNAAGYFYGDKPSGSNWSFNRVEDFAESVAMYVAWGRGNDLSSFAEMKIQLYQLANGATHKFFGVDNWADYKRYFYPEDGDYTKTKRWQFVDNLMKGRIEV